MEDDATQEIIDRVLTAIDNEDRDDVIPAVVTVLMCMVHHFEIPKQIMLSYVADSLDNLEKRKKERKKDA
jgi:hypothetical protein